MKTLTRPLSGPLSGPLLEPLFRPGPWGILRLFYLNRNAPLHLRGIARKARLNESSASRHLNALAEAGILRESRQANLRTFVVTSGTVESVFPLFDDERLASLPMLRRDAIAHYLGRLTEQPVLVIIFGSTADNTFTDESDIDILEVFAGKTDTRAARAFSEAQTGIRIHPFQMTEHEFDRELKEKVDLVVQSALRTGFPVWNHRFYYRLMHHERAGQNRDSTALMLKLQSLFSPTRGSGRPASRRSRPRKRSSAPRDT